MDVGGENVEKSKIQENLKKCQEMVPKYQECIEMGNSCSTSPPAVTRLTVNRRLKSI